MALHFIIWDIDPNIIDSWETPRWYGVLWTIGLVLGFQTMQFIYKKEGRPLKELDNLALYSIVGTILGARLGHVLFYDPAYYWQHPIEILPIKLEPHFEFVGLAGLASHGGGIGLLIALYLFSRKNHISFLWILDRIAIAAGVVGGFIRLGNLVNSEMIGTPTNLPWGFVFIQIDQIPRHPAQLYEAIFCFLLFAFLFHFWQTKMQDKPHGYLFGLFLILLFTQRFVVEFFKINQEAFEDHLWLNMGQILSIPFVVLGIGIVFWLERNKMGKMGNV